MRPNMHVVYRPKLRHIKTFRRRRVPLPRNHTYQRMFILVRLDVRRSNTFQLMVCSGPTIAITLNIVHPREASATFTGRVTYSVMCSLVIKYFCFAPLACCARGNCPSPFCPLPPLATARGGTSLVIWKCRLNETCQFGRRSTQRDYYTSPRRHYVTSRISPLICHADDSRPSGGRGGGAVHREAEKKESLFFYE